MKSVLPCTLVLLSYAVAFQQLLAADANLVRIVVLDRSGSMAGERLEEAKREILDFGRQLPPTKDLPIIIVPFTDTAENGRVFTDLPGLEQYLAELQAGGGTSIASGLAQAIRQLKPLQGAAHLCVLLYTDGDDGNRAAIQQQEDQLDKLFADRSQRGLSQTVYCKRWQQANAQLIETLRRRGHAQIVDAGELALQPVILNPGVRVDTKTWSSTEPWVLHLELSAIVAVKGQPRGAVSALRFAAQNPSVLGAKTVDVVPGQPAISFPLNYKVSPAEQKAGRVELDFAIHCPATVSLPSGILIPLLPKQRLTIPFDIPPLKFQSTLSAKLRSDSPVTWHDPLISQIRAPLILDLEVESQPSAPWQSPLTIGISSLPGQQILVGGNDIAITGPGTKSIPVTIVTSMDGTSGVIQPGGKFEVGVLVSVKGPSSLHAVTPASVRITQSCAAPALVDAHLSARTLSVGKTRWVDLAQSRAAFEAQIEVTVDGPIRKNERLTVHASGNIHRVRFEPPFIVSGKQVVNMFLEAELAPAPTQQTLAFHIDPPPPEGAIAPQAPLPFEMVVTGPPPVQMVLAQQGTVSRIWQKTLWKPGSSITFSATPTLVGNYSPGAGNGISARLPSTPSLGFAGQTQAPVQRLVTLPLTIANDQPVSFFHDRIIEGKLTVLPEPHARAVVGSLQIVRIRIEAPFKLLLFIVTTVAGSLGVILWLIRQYGRMSAVETSE